VNGMALGHILSQSITRNEEYRLPLARASAAQPQAALSNNLNRLLSAAVVSPRFQRLLLTNPVAALAAGYNGETFQLTQAEYAAVTSLCVHTIREFATQLLRILQEAVPFGAESQPDFQFAEATNAVREQSTTLPLTGQACKQEVENPYSRFAAPSRPAPSRPTPSQHARYSVAVNEAYRTNAVTKRYGS